jgi:hypothetical protein
MGILAGERAEWAGGGGGGRRATLLLIAGFWSAAFGLLSIRGALVEPLPFATLGPRRMLLAIVGGCLCYGMARVMERLGQRPFGERMAWSLAGAIAMSALLTLIHQVAYRVIDPLPGAPPICLRDGIVWGIVWLGYFAAWTGLHLALVALFEAIGAGVPAPAIAPVERPAPAPPLESFWAHRHREYVRVRIEDLVWAEAEGDYVRLHAAGGGGLVRETLRAIEQALDPRLFIRVHRSALVRRSAIAALRRKESGAIVLALAGGGEVPVGRRYGKGLRALIGEMRREG